MPETIPDYSMSKPSHVHLIAAARPNFMKIAPLWHALRAADDFEPAIVHTGQHYDAAMSDDIFADLGLPAPDFHLGVGSGSHAEQTGGVMIAYEKVAQAHRPDWLIVVGDVNSTAACAMVGAKLRIPTVHLEAGLRSWDRDMPEEINRLVTDVIADVLWTPSPDADENLKREGIADERVTRVGNIMMDHHFFAADPWQKTWAMKYATFFKGVYAMKPVGDEFNLDGTVRHSNAEPSGGLLAQNALVAFAAPSDLGTPLLQNLWNMAIPTGQYRYYDGMLYMLAALHASGHFRLPPARTTDSIDFLAAKLGNLSAETVIHNLSDADYIFAGPAVTAAVLILTKLAPDYGFDPTDAAKFNNGFRNPALSYLSAERILIRYNHDGLSGVRHDLDALKKAKVI